MKLVTPVEIRARVQKLWEGQKLLRAWLEAESIFPLEIPLGTPGGTELVERFAEVRAWIAALKSEARPAKAYGYEVLEQQVEHRQLGFQRLPMRAVIPTPEDALRLAGKWQAFQRFQTLVAVTRGRFPALEPLLRARPLAVLDHEAVWDRLLDVAAHLVARPQPGCYVRELDVPGVDTKFVEGHGGMLWEILTLVVPPEGQDPSVQRREAHAFERRFGLRYDPPLIRFRMLDPAISGFKDVSVPLAEFARWAPTEVETVFITENKVNGLAFPPMPRAIVVFGLGYGIRALGEVPWLGGKALMYWGDLDTHGFAILARLRGKWFHVRSLLMDEETLLAHRGLWGQEPEGQRCREDLPALTTSERDVYEGLREDRWGERVRLEQERIPFGVLERALGLKGL